MSAALPEMAEKMLDNVGKLKIADHARLMADNQATIERSNRSDDSHRDYTQRVREAQARTVFGDNWEPPMPVKPGDDQMQIFIDSPVTVSQREQPVKEPSQPPPAPSATTAAKLLAWPLAVAAGIAAGAGIMSLVDREPLPPVVVPADIVFPAYDVERWVPGEAQ